MEIWILLTFFLSMLSFTLLIVHLFRFHELFMNVAATIDYGVDYRI